MIDLAPAEEIAGRADTEREMGLPPCLFCSTPLRHTVVDLGMSPLCETFLEAAELNQMEQPVVRLVAAARVAAWEAAEARKARENAP